MSDLNLNLGCGSKRLENYLNVDKFGEPDLRVDLEQFPWPWEDNSVANIELRHVLEHLGQKTETYLQIIQEIYRICQPQAKLHIVVPHHRSEYFLHDPTHVRPITVYGMKMFSKKFNQECAEKGYSTTPLGTYIGVDFEILEVNYVPDERWYKREPDWTGDIDYLLEQSSFYNNLIMEVDMMLTVIK